MVHLDVVSAEQMLQFGALCLLTAVCYAGILHGEGPWERLDSVRRDIERQQEGAMHDLTTKPPLGLSD